MCFAKSTSAVLPLILNPQCLTLLMRPQLGYKWRDRAARLYNKHTSIEIKLILDEISYPDRLRIDFSARGRGSAAAAGDRGDRGNLKLDVSYARLAAGALRMGGAQKSRQLTRKRFVKV